MLYLKRKITSLLLKMVNFYNRMAQERSSETGFTFLELMVAVGILVVAITGLLSAFINASLLSQANRNKIIAVNDAQYVLEKVRTNPDYDAPGSYNVSNFTNLNLASESIFVTVSSPSANKKNVVANVTWIDERQQTRSFNLITQFVD